MIDSEASHYSSSPQPPAAPAYQLPATGSPTDTPQQLSKSLQQASLPTAGLPPSRQPHLISEALRASSYSMIPTPTKRSPVAAPRRYSALPISSPDTNSSEDATGPSTPDSNTPSLTLGASPATSNTEDVFESESDADDHGQGPFSRAEWDQRFQNTMKVVRRVLQQYDLQAKTGRKEKRAVGRMAPGELYKAIRLRHKDLRCCRSPSIGSNW
ncbi:hypothetical protein LTR10_001982 [Elasticomyces elasticus]|uniref:Uncharacterized protein n=1 Tax=Elasticomyces elasticus TaxID=574655 RepID=A0AAN7WD04_9PEZI|nr:hypothetical protein LTR10_001982 [Elasticomyces elasticus]KAK4969196.1 hypothetical protein LTR42_009475 [Elasticomyces elasticus]KAK5708053.1 hypothetical protein LTR97_000593 [Elasticomyces elasticus]